MKYVWGFRGTFRKEISSVADEKGSLQKEPSSPVQEHPGDPDGTPIKERLVPRPVRERSFHHDKFPP